MRLDLMQFVRDLAESTLHQLPAADVELVLGERGQDRDQLTREPRTGERQPT